MSDTSKIAKNLQAFQIAINAHDRENPTHTAYGIGLAHFDMERLGLDELHGLDTGLPVRVIGDACASPPIGDRSAAEIDRATLAVAGSLSALADSREVLQVASNVIVSLRGA